MPTLTSFPAALLAALPDGHHTFESIALAILGIGLLIFVHELGHFLACRLTRTRVETFSMGFGPRLFGRESRGGVSHWTFGPRRSPASEGSLDFRVSAIPLGGYVKMAGEVGGDGSPGSADGGARKPLSDEFPAKPFLARAFIISAGVMMNFLAAFVLLTVAYAKGLEETPPIVGHVVVGDPAWEAGVRPGDLIESFGGTPVRSFEEFHQEVLFASSSSAPEIVVLRDGRRLTLPLKPRYDEEHGWQQAGVGPSASWTVDDGKSPAFTIGPADPVTIDGRPLVGGFEAADAAAVAQRLGRKTVRIVVGSGAAAGSHEVVLPTVAPDAKPGHGWKLGVSITAPLVVGRVRPGSPAAAAGLQAHDRLVAADGVPVWREPELEFLGSIGALEVSRDGKPVSLAVHAADPAAVAALLEGISFEGKGPPIVVPDGSAFADGKSPAAEAGIRPGDQITEIAGKPVASTSDLMARVAALTGESVSVAVRGPDGGQREVQVKPKTPADASKAETFFGGTGLVAPRVTVAADGFLDAVTRSAVRSVREVKNIFRMIGRFVGGEISPAKNLGGPGTIVNLASSSVSLGLSAFLSFLAFISVNLAVLNILPVPVLDGGSLLLLIIERLRGGRPLKEGTIASLQWVGFALLMLLMVFAVKNDFGNLTK